ncbi:MAG TPA: rhombosortase [Pirellulales bacterium]|nr:rhombosortase [Pirellulales bacterium]
MPTLDLVTESASEAAPADNALAGWRSKTRALPWATLLLSAAAILFQLFPAVGDRMAFDSAAIAGGHWWRLLSGHLTHCDAEHLTWDVLMFGLLGGLIERRSRRWLLATVGASAAAISFALWFGHPGLEQYRGLSGIDSALFTFALLMLLDDARRAGQTIAVWLLWAMAAGLALKIGWESATGTTLFVDSARAGFVPLPSVHAVGGIVGIAAWLASRRRKIHGARRAGPATSSSPLELGPTYGCATTRRS